MWKSQGRCGTFLAICIYQAICTTDNFVSVHALYFFLRCRSQHKGIWLNRRATKIPTICSASPLITMIHRDDSNNVEMNFNIAKTRSTDGAKLGCGHRVIDKQVLPFGVWIAAIELSIFSPHRGLLVL